MTPSSTQSGRRALRRLGFALIVTLFVGVLLQFAPASAQDPSSTEDADISIPFEEILFSAPGTATEVASLTVEPRLVGKTCDLQVVAENQSSIHPGNDLVVTTGTTETIIRGVENEVDEVSDERYRLILGETIIVHLTMGPDGMSSLGFSLSFECDPPSCDTGTSTGATAEHCCDSDTATGSASAEASADKCCDPSEMTGAASAGTAMHDCDPKVDGGLTERDDGLVESTVPPAITDSGESAPTASATAEPETIQPTPAPEPEVLQNLVEAPAANSVSGEPTYTG